jgi:type IV pilus assembly protein PilC
MEKFEYKAKNKEGKTLKGIVEATNEKQAVSVLRERGLLVINLKLKKESFGDTVKSTFFRKISLTDKVNFTRQLATMLTAGLRVTESLEILETQTSPAMRRIVEEIRRDIEGGRDLSSSLEKHPEAFDPVYVALVKAGESAGVLEKVLTRLADNLEKQKEFHGKIKSAMIYPIIIILGMMAVTGVMVIFVIPKMTALYEEFQTQLPLPTRILLGVSRFVSLFWWLILLMIGGLAVGFRILLKNSTFRKQYDQALFKLPILGNIRQKSILTEFTRTLGLLVGTGILIVDALRILKGSLGSLIYQEAIEKTAKEVEKGLPLASALAETGVFPFVLPQMISVGEETGKLDEVLQRVSNYFQQESENAVKGLTTAMEPIIMIILGIGVAFLMISVIMPIYNLTSQF